jgi:SAM-dependent methyltransferase
MIAPAALPREYASWNSRWHAPFGRTLPFRGSLAWTRPALIFKGPFAFQPNNVTREFEYPWAFAQIASRVSRGTVVEIGGGLSGMQFVLARSGYDVINVDPGNEARGKGWSLNQDEHRYLTRIFRAPVTLVPTTLDESRLPDGSVDVVLSVSTLEHLTPSDLSAAAKSIARILKPQGCVVLTIDLFLDLAPFGNISSNQWGANVDVYAFLREAALELEVGEPRHLCGFPEFDRDDVLRRRAAFLEGNYATVAQCLVARPVRQG